jgi:hypothetical protein
VFTAGMSPAADDEVDGKGWEKNWRRGQPATPPTSVVKRD